MYQGFTVKVPRKKMINFMIFLFMTVLFSLLFAKWGYAHAVLEQANPSANSQLKIAPSMVELTFNERLEKELYSIRVLNQLGQPITENPTQMSIDQTKISLELPPLKDGIYTVAYHIMSADGHPVEQSYVFSVGVAKGISNNVSFPTEVNQHEGWMFYLYRILYYLSMLFLTGWLFWGIYFPFSKTETEVKREYDFWLPWLKHFYVLMIMVMGLGQFSIMLSGFGKNELLSVLLGTTFGLTWIGALLLSLLGYVVLRRRKWIDLLWVVVILSIEGINGHAISFRPAFLTVLLDILHLVTASIWVGGLLILAFIWRKYRDRMPGFLPLFSRTALYSMITLVITGVVSTFLFLPKWGYLLATTWGYLLMAKTILVVLVLIIACIIRLNMTKHKGKLGTWIKWDFSLMLIIIGMVGVLTYQSPVPANQPLYWHQMESGIMVTTQITPNVPGTNKFNVEVDLSKDNTQLKHIELFLKNRDKEIAAIPIPLQPISTEQSPGNFGLQVYKYSSEGPYLPFAGDWTIEIRILDSNDDETVYSKDFTVY